MAAPVSARDMILAARRITGTESLDPANAFVTDDEALAVLNGQLAELYDAIIEQGLGDYFRGTQTITLEAGQTIYPLGVDVLEIVSVDVVWSADIVRSGKLFMEAERNRFRRLNAYWTHLCDVYFRTLGDNLEVMPTPLTGVRVDINFVPAFVPLVALTDTFNSHNQWHWFAIWGLVEFIRLKDDDEPGAGVAATEKEKVRARVTSMAGRRVEGEAPRVQRVRYRDDEEEFF